MNGTTERFLALGVRRLVPAAPGLVRVIVAGTEFDRASGIGGSDISAILGVNPWRTPFDVYLEKTRDPSWSPEAENARMRLGKLLEPALRVAYVQDHPDRAIEVEDATLWHPNRISYAHIDGISYGADPFDPTTGIWEGKSSRDDRDWKEGVPPYYEAQVRQYLAITGEAWCDVTCLFLNTAEIEHYRIAADPATDNALIKIGEDWWHEHIEPRVPPEVDGSDAAARFLSARYPVQIMEPAIIAPPAVDEIGKALSTIRFNEKQIAGARANAENAIKSFMGEHGAIQGTGWRATWKRSRPATHVGWEEVATAYRHLIEEIRGIAQIVDRRERETALMAQRFFTDEALDAILGLYTTTGAAAHPFVFKDED